MTPPRIVPYASIFKWLAQVWSLAGWILKCCSDGLWLLILGVGACLPTLLFLYQPGWWYRIQGQQPVSHSILTLLWKGTLLQELILETRVMPPFHCCSWLSENQAGLQFCFCIKQEETHCRQLFSNKIQQTFLAHHCFCFSFEYM